MHPGIGRKDGAPGVWQEVRDMGLASRGACGRGENAGLAAWGWRLLRSKPPPAVPTFLLSQWGSISEKGEASRRV